MTMTAILVCEICNEPLARYVPKRMHLPLSGDQFLPLEEGYPLPFPEPAGMVDWEAMRCPFCHFRPIIQESRLPTKGGRHVIIKAGEVPKDAE